jgi:soluble cytochrome b562
VDRQIHRAADNARKIDVRRTYPGSIPRTVYTLAAMVLVFLGLNFIAVQHPSNGATTVGSVRNTSRGGSLDVQKINAGLARIAAHLQESEKLRRVAEALTERRLDLAAEELRKLAAQLDRESPQSLQDIQEALKEAAGNSEQGLENLAEDLGESAHALENKNIAATQEALEEVAEDLEDIEESIYDPESTLDQLARGNEQRAEQDGNVSAAPIPKPRDFPQAKSSAESLGDSGGKTEGGPRRGPSTTLAVKLQQEGVKSMLNPGIPRVDVEQASRRERSKLDYRNVKSELTAAQKDVLNHENMPWKYRPLIKNYFGAVPGPVKK